MSVTQTVVHARCTCCLHAVNLDLGIEGLDGKGDTADESASTDGHYHRLDVGQLLQEFQTDGALACNDERVVEGVDECVAMLIAQRQGPGVGIVIHTGYETDFGSQTARGLHFADGSAFGQADERLDAVGRGAKCHALCMVAGRTGHYAPLLLLWRQL